MTAAELRLELRTCILVHSRWMYVYMRCRCCLRSLREVVLGVCHGQTSISSSSRCTSSTHSIQQQRGQLAYLWQ